jgi:hypothetical protein
MQQQQSTFSHPYDILYKDMKRFIHYMCSCACFYPEEDVLPNQCEHRPSSETMIHFAQDSQADKHTYNTTTSSKSATADEVQHHKSSIQMTQECKNPMHSVITLPPAPIVPNTSETDCPMSSSSSDDEDTIRINVSEVEDFSVASSSKKEDPWHVL